MHTKLSISDTIPITRPTITEQFNVLIVENNMNSVAVDANNFQQNLQLTCHAIQYNYQNNNLPFYRESQVSGHQELQTIANNNNNYHCHWLHKSNPNSISSTNQQQHIDRYNEEIQVKPTVKIPAVIENSATEDNVNDLIEAFNNSIGVSEAKQIQLPQIVLSDFSSDQPTPPTNPLFFTIQNSQTLSEYPPQIEGYQIFRSHYEQVYTRNH